MHTGHELGAVAASLGYDSGVQWLESTEGLHVIAKKGKLHVHKIIADCAE